MGYDYPDSDLEDDEGDTSVMTKSKVKLKNLGYAVGELDPTPPCRRGTVIRINDIAFITYVCFFRFTHNIVDKCADSRPSCCICILATLNLHRMVG